MNISLDHRTLIATCHIPRNRLGISFNQTVMLPAFPVSPSVRNAVSSTICGVKTLLTLFILAQSSSSPVLVDRLPVMVSLHESLVNHLQWIDSWISVHTAQADQLWTDIQALETLIEDARRATPVSTTLHLVYFMPLTVLQCSSPC
jgi:hypothetical protein